jgi:hypothetical protein
MSAKIPVYLETTPKRTFAVAIEWPGWARAGKTPDDALAALAAYAKRYAVVARRARVAFPDVRDASSFEVVERIKGGAGTEFGVPGEIAQADRSEIKPAESDRLSSLLEAAWKSFDAAADAAEGKELRKGPRGGGRDLDKIREHVFEAERAYLSKLGGASGKAAEGLTLAEIRTDAVETFAARAHGTYDMAAAGKRTLWEPRYFVRRSAWHVLDHAWEIEDRAGTPRRTGSHISRAD